MQAVFIFVLAASFLGALAKSNNPADDSPHALGFDGVFTRTNTKNVTLPTNRAMAESLGWVMTEREDTPAGICRELFGIEYTEGAKKHSRSQPMSLFFQKRAEGRVTAFSVRAYFTSEANYNPEQWQAPHFGVQEEGERWITITTRDLGSACLDETPTLAGSEEKESFTLGSSLVMNANMDGLESGLKIPLYAPHDPTEPWDTIHKSPIDQNWKRGACMDNMSQHWAYTLTGSREALFGGDHGKNVVPVIPMYSVPDEVKGHGHKATALAFFTTEPQVTYSQGGIWDATGTPAQLCAGNFCEDSSKCEFGDTGNSVFHVFFIDQWSAPAQCGAWGSTGCPAGGVTPP